VSNLLLSSVRNSSSDCRVRCFCKFIFAFKLDCRLLYTFGSPFKGAFRRINVIPRPCTISCYDVYSRQAKQTYVLCTGNRRYYPIRFESINAINLLINLGNRSFNFNSVTQLPLIMILGLNVFPLLELINF
jgi:hypothetical protein